MFNSSDKSKVMIFVQNKSILDEFCDQIESLGLRISDTDPGQEFLQKNSETKAKSDTDTYNAENLLRFIKSEGMKTLRIVLATHDLSIMKVCESPQSNSLAEHPTLSEIEKDHIIETLEKCGWRCKSAAKLLGIDRSTIYRKMKKYGIITVNQ